MNVPNPPLSFDQAVRTTLIYLASFAPAGFIHHSLLNTSLLGSSPGFATHREAVLQSLLDHQLVLFSDDNQLLLVTELALQLGKAPPFDGLVWDKMVDFAEATVCQRLADRLETNQGEGFANVVHYAQTIADRACERRSECAFLLNKFVGIALIILSDSDSLHYLNNALDVYDTTLAPREDLISTTLSVLAALSIFGESSATTVAYLRRTMSLCATVLGDAHGITIEARAVLHKKTATIAHN